MMKFKLPLWVSWTHAYKTVDIAYHIYRQRKGRATDTPNNVQHVSLGMFSTDVSDHWHAYHIYRQGKRHATDSHDDVPSVGLSKFSNIFNN